MLQGPTMDPRIASELLMRLPHLHLRMAEHCKRARAMAAALHDLGAEVGRFLGGVCVCACTASLSGSIACWSTA
jgi:hypothetical protein